jgi:hypothetical protein
MADEKPQAHPLTAILTPTVAIMGLMVSLLGNAIQYRSLQAKQEELAQAQTKLDDNLLDSQRRREAADKYVSDVEQRILDVDSKIAEAESEERRGAAGMAFAPMDQKELAIATLTGAREAQKNLAAERAKLQDKLDAARALFGGR